MNFHEEKDEDKLIIYRVLRFGIWVSVEGIGPVIWLFFRFLFSATLSLYKEMNVCAIIEILGLHKQLLTIVQVASTLRSRMVCHHTACCQINRCIMDKQNEKKMFLVLYFHFLVNVNGRSFEAYRSTRETQLPISSGICPVSLFPCKSL